MGELVVTEFISLDGVIEEPKWTFEFDRGEAGNDFKDEELMAADVQLLGRITYEGFAEAWPKMRDSQGEYGEKFNAMPHFVVSTTFSDEDASWDNSTVIREDVAGSVQKLKDEIENDILVQGSSRLVQTLAAERLVDRYRLMLFPIVLGGGKRLFEAGTPRETLTVERYEPVGPDGVMVSELRVKRSDP
jgi:dihydrofolate reductase